MAYQPEISNYEGGIYQWEIGDPVQGGLGGIDNLPILQLANRTRALRDQLNVVLADLTGLAPINSPLFTGTPQGPTPAAGDSSQALANTSWVRGAVASIAAGRQIGPFRIFASPGSFLYVPSPGVTAFEWLLRGAGGGGGGSQAPGANAASSGGGGGEGGEVRGDLLVSAVPSGGIPVTLGSPGLGGGIDGSGNALPGQDGGSSALGTFAGVYGGHGGFAGTIISGNGQTGGGLGGLTSLTAGVYSISRTGRAGGLGFVSGTANVSGGDGGGDGGAHASANNNGAGANGFSGGGGGGSGIAGAPARSGGNGGGPLLIIWERT